MRRLKTILWLEGYALLLAVVQEHNGVRTDEAKYLLDIPYPHPPLARWLLSLFDGLSWQELGARIVFATLLVQAVWIVWDMGRSLWPSGKIAVAVLWLGSASFVLQAGTVMMAPITALQALLFLWILSLPRERVPSAAAIGFLWLMTLFTALQGALLFPLVVAALRLRGASWKLTAWYALAPVVIVGIYALGNPFVLASVLIQSGKDAGDTLGVRLAGLAWIMVLAGSGVGTLVGTVGVLIKKHAWILASFLLVALYVFTGRFEYYAILFLPFFVTGSTHLLRRFPRVAVPMAAGIITCTALIIALYRPLLVPRSPARYVLTQLSAPATILLKGSFGHEWQYEALPGQQLLQYSAGTDPVGDVVVCFDRCEEIESSWVEQGGGLANTWWRMARGVE